MKLAHCLGAAALITSLLTLPVGAYPAKEADILLTTSYATATAAQKNRKGAEAFCREAKSKLTKDASEAYLEAYIERCFAAVADAFDDKPVACKRYGKSLAIWDKSPPPSDHPQSVASRNQLRILMQRYVTTNCPAK
jgi:hypothetical protein